MTKGRPAPASLDFRAPASGSARAGGRDTVRSALHNIQWPAPSAPPAAAHCAPAMEGQERSPELLCVVAPEPADSGARSVSERSENLVRRPTWHKSLR